MIRGTLLERWWGQSGSDNEETVFCLRFPKGRWNIPWELLIADLFSARRRANTCVVRALESAVPASPRVFREPLRILIVQGDDGAFMGQRLDFAAEIGGLMSAWETLEKGVQECVPRPVVATVTIDNFTSLLSAHRPHILWFSGHGESKPSSRLLFANRTWVEASEFCRLVGASGHPPLYAVFWACDTADATDENRDAPAPPSLFEGLRKVGVLSLLAMQAPIRDVSARAMAADLLRSLAAGLPLELATARARANQFERKLEYAHELDWACPVVWSAGELTGQRLHWNAGASGLMEFQLLGRLILRLRLAPAGELESPPNADELHRAAVWAAHPRVWVKGSSEGQHRYAWARVLRAIQTETTSWVIALDLRHEDATAALQQWAEDISAGLLPGDIPDEIALALSEMRRTPSTGWRKLCQREMTLALSGRVPPDAAEWFWEPLRSTRNSPRVLVLSEKEINDEIYENWLVDSLGADMSEAAITTAIAEAPDLARALAVLNIPLQSHRLTISAPDVTGARSLAEWRAAHGMLVDTPAGPLIAATARHAVLANLSSADLQKAHRHCVEMLGEPTLALSTHFREHRLAHLIEAGEFPELAIEEAALLCGVYRSEGRPRAVLGVIERLGKLQTGLSSSAKLMVAWANLRLGHVEAASYWLRHVAVLGSSLEVAEKHGLSAEIQKSIGAPDSKNAALAEIEAAIDICAKAAKKHDADSHAARRMERAYRQDHARILQYLFYDRPGAAAEYERLLIEWRDEPGAETDLAVVRRNLAECLRNMPEAAANAPRVRGLIAEAELGLKGHFPTPILAELLYEKSKAAESEGDVAGARRYLDECRDAALKSEHHLVFAIAENRHFWRYESFDEKRWQDLKTQLASFSPHGWAVRACIDGRLRAARHFEGRGEWASAHSELSENFDDLQRHPSFDAGTDRFRIAATLAGLEILGPRVGREEHFWAQFLARYEWAEEWLAAREGRAPQEIWSEV